MSCPLPRNIIICLTVLTSLCSAAAFAQSPPDKIETMGSLADVKERFGALADEFQDFDFDEYVLIEVEADPSAETVSVETLGSTPISLEPALALTVTVTRDNGNVLVSYLYGTGPCVTGMRPPPEWQAQCQEASKIQRAELKKTAHFVAIERDGLEDIKVTAQYTPPPP